MAKEAALKERSESTTQKQKLAELYSVNHKKSKKPARLTKRERKSLGIGKDEGRAILRYARISSRKVKIVIDLIIGKALDEAYAILKHSPKAASEILLKLLKSAESNAVNNNDLNRDELFVAEAYANQGPTLKRIRPRARGSANRIRKRTSHITLVLRERNKGKEVE
ncbi:MAG: 50S ribosomal protein L22 [Clostridiaceae bacterium]|nr:50S ribosomal protein L22 [Clostridiaceae bacterium]